MSDAVTIVVGAGAVLDFDHKGIFPTVNNITDEVIKLNISTVNGGVRPLIKELNDHIIERLNQLGLPEVRKCYPPQLNFENLLHAIEMCCSYSSCWHDEYQYWKAFPIFGALMGADHLLADIETFEYEWAAYKLQERVMEIINQYDSDFKEQKNSEDWYRTFWQSINVGNIFTLNYDSTIEESLGNYEDGFENENNIEEFSHFSAKRYCENRKMLTTIAHLHGSILYSEQKTFPFEYSIRDLVKNKDYETAKKNRIARQSPPRNQAGETYVQPYVISGARKIEKMVCAPYNVYLSDLTRKVIENERLVIIGYSFGDLYLNEILGLGMAAHGDNFKVVIIDKYPPYVDNYSLLFQNIKGTNKYSFISRLAKDRLYIKILQKDFPLIVKDYNTPVVSKNGNLMMCMTGFKDSVVNHGDEIKRFLSLD